MRRARMWSVMGLLLVTVMMCWTVFAEATSLSISPDPLVGSPGDTLLTSVEYLAQGAQVTSLQFDVLYDPSALSLWNVQVGSATTLASKDFDSNTLSPGDTRFVIFGLNQNVIGDGSLAHLTFPVSFNAPAGPYNLSLSSIFASDATGSLVNIANLNPPSSGSVPIPSTLLPLGIGLIGLVAWHSLRKAGTA